MPPQRTNRALAEVVQYLTSYLSCNSDIHNLRLICCAVRDAHDASAKLLTLGSRRIAEHALASGQEWHPPSLDEVEATVKAVVARGGRPSQLELALPAALDAQSRETITLAMVQHLHPPQSNRSITEVAIFQCATLTPVSAAALCLLGPKLKCLRLHSSPHDGPSPQHSVEVLDTMARSVSLLLQGLGPQLQALEAMLKGHWRPQMLRPLSRCTALTRLVGAFNFYEATGGDAEAALEAEVDLMRTVSSLTGLRDLTLGGGVVPREDFLQRAAQPAPTISSLSTLTALTSLSLKTYGLMHYLGHDKFDLDVEAAELQQEGRARQAAQLYSAAAAGWSALLAAVKDLPFLAVLDTRARVPASDLAALTSLTRLTVGKLALPRDDGGLGAGWMDYTLPPRLRLLDTIAPLPVRVAARLAPAPLLPPPLPESLAGAAAAEGGTAPRLPQPPLVGLRAVDVFGRVGRIPWRLAFEEGDLDEGGALRPEAAAAMRQTVPALLRCFGFLGGSKGKQPERGLCVVVHSRSGEPVKPPPTLLAAGAGAGGAQVPGAVEAPSHCASWLGSLAAVRPEVLRLEGLWLSARDMMGLADCMAGRKVLHLLNCRYMVSSLPLLATMPHLAELVVQCGDWDWDCFVSDEAGLDGVEAAFLALTANKPSSCSSAPGEQGAVPGSSGAPAAVPAALPQLRLIKVRYNTNDLHDAAERLGRALARPRQQLQQRGGRAEVLLVQRTD